MLTLVVNAYVSCVILRISKKLYTTIPNLTNPIFSFFFVSLYAVSIDYKSLANLLESIHNNKIQSLLKIKLCLKFQKQT